METPGPNRCSGCLDRDRRIRQLEAENARLHEENARLHGRIGELVAQAEIAARQSKRQAAPFSNDNPKTNPRRPGRKSGESHGTHGHRPTPAPDAVDETFDVPVGPCPHCGGKVEETETVVQYQQEIPRKPIVRKFVIHRGRCMQCGRPCRGRHPLQTSDAIGAAASQVGAEAQAGVVYLNKHAGMSYGKVRDLYRKFFGIRLTRGAAAQIVLRAGKRLEPAVFEIDEHLKQARHITPDESGWRVGGRPAWIHAWVADDGATRYRIDPRRSADALEQIIGIGWSGSMTHDGLSTYDRFVDAVHQQCVNHALRRAEGLIETQEEADRIFPQQVIDVCMQGLRLRDCWESKEPTPEQRERAYERYADRIEELAAEPQKSKANATFARHLDRHGGEWFTFLLDRSIPATNFEAEQALKTPIVNRKVWGGNRTPNGKEAQEATSSVIQTCGRRGIEILDYISDALRGVIGSLFA